MTRYAAFLRGINLGRRRVTGEDLCKPFERLGFTGVASFLASGNVVFDVEEPEPPADLSARVEAELEDALGYEVQTFLRDEAELAAIVARTPFSPAELARTAGKAQVILLQGAPDAGAAAAVLEHASDADRLALHDTELHWLPAEGISTSPLDLRAIERLLGSMTIRTANTLARLHSKHFQEAGGR